MRWNALCPIPTDGRACRSSAAVSFPKNVRPQSGPMMEKAAIRAAAEGILHNRFMHEDFRDGQLEAVKAVVDMDVLNVSVLSIMGTGHGKVRHISSSLILELRDATYSSNAASVDFWGSY